MKDKDVLVEFNVGLMAFNRAMKEAGEAAHEFYEAMLLTLPWYRRWLIRAEVWLRQRWYNLKYRRRL